MGKSRRTITAWELVVQALVLAALLVPLFPRVFFEGDILLPGGLLFDTPPWKPFAPADFQPTTNKLTLEALCEFDMYYTLTKRALENGEWPLWNHLEFTGVPLLAAYQPAVFYPPRLLHALLDIYQATTLHILFKLWLCGATAYLCARGIGLGRAGSRFFSVAWMLCSYHAIWCYWPLPDVGAWLPILVLGIEWTLSGRYRSGFYVTALGATMILLAGHPETAFAMGVCAGLYFLGRLVASGWWLVASHQPLATSHLLKPLAVAGGAWLLALLVCAAQLLPFFEYLFNSYHFVARIQDDPSNVALPTSAWVLFWAPKFFGVTAEGNFWGNELHSNFTNLVFPGVAVWFGLACLKDIRTWDSRRRAQAVCLVVCAVFCFLCAFNHPAVAAFLHLPVVRSMWFRWYTGAGVFALQLAAALGVDAWFSKPRRPRELVWMLVPAVIVVAAVCGAYGFYASLLAAKSLDGYVRQQMLIAAGVAGLCLACFGAHCLWRRPKVLAAALTLVLALDLIHAVRGIHPTSPRSWLFFETRLTDFLKNEEPPCRVANLTTGISTGFMPIYGIEEYFGYGGILPLRFSQFFRDMGEDAWNSMMPTLGLQYFLHDPGRNPYFLEYAPDRFELAAALDGIEVYRYKDAMDRAFLVGQARVVPNLKEMFSIMRTREFNPRREALLEAPVSGLGQDAQTTNQPGAAHVTKRTSTHVAIEADAARDCVLVLADAYYPGWTATIDGIGAPVFPVDSIYRGVVLPPGRHIVRFDYFPWTFRLGLAISVVFLSLSSLIAVYHLVRGRRARRPQDAWTPAR